MASDRPGLVPGGDLEQDCASGFLIGNLGIIVGATTVAGFMDYIRQCL